MYFIKGCIFDLDGVLVDTAKYHYLAWKKLCTELGFELTKEDNEKLKGVGRLESLNILLSLANIDCSRKAKLELTNKKNTWYVEYISQMDNSELLPGVEDFLYKVKKQDIKIALGSSSKNSMLVLKNTGILHYFDVIIDGNKIKNSKPNPEVFLLALKELNLKASECVVFEDALSGIEAAKNAHIKTIGVGARDILIAADKVISCFQNLDLNILSYDFLCS
jgi:beta-phosphoglucomutase